MLLQVLVMSSSGTNVQPHTLMFHPSQQSCFKRERHIYLLYYVRYIEPLLHISLCMIWYRENISSGILEILKQKLQNNISKKYFPSTVSGHSIISDNFKNRKINIFTVNIVSHKQREERYTIQTQMYSLIHKSEKVSLLIECDKIVSG